MVFLFELSFDAHIEGFGVLTNPFVLISHVEGSFLEGQVAASEIFGLNELLNSGRLYVLPEVYVLFDKYPLEFTVNITSPFLVLLCSFLSMLVLNSQCFYFVVKNKLFLIELVSVCLDVPSYFFKRLLQF